MGAPDAAGDGVRQPAEVPIFILGGRTLTVAEIIRAARFRGELATHEKDLRLKLACAGKAEAQSLEADGEALQERADQFRYDRDLITTEETEAWFENGRWIPGSWPPTPYAIIGRSCWKTKWPLLKRRMTATSQPCSSRNCFFPARWIGWRGSWPGGWPACPRVRRIRR